MEGGGKKTKGRQKIEMKRIEKEENRMVTFSKRRSGINKKISELVTLCGAEVAFVTFSPGGKSFSFAHPFMETVISHFFNLDRLHPNDNARALVEAHKQLRINELSQQYDEYNNLVGAEMERAKELKRLTKNKEPLGWWDAPIDQLSLPELKELCASFEDLHEKLLNEVKKRDATGHASSSSSSSTMNPVALGINPFGPGGNDIDPGMINSFGLGTSNNDPGIFGPHQGASAMDPSMNLLPPSINGSADANIVLPPQPFDFDGNGQF